MKPRISVHALVLVVVTAVVLLAANVFIRTDLRQERVDAERQAVEILVRSFGDQMQQRFVSIQTSLAAIAEKVASNSYSEKEIHLILKQARDSAEILRVIGVTDTTGQVVYSSRGIPPPNVNLAGRDYVKYFLDGGTASHYLSSPNRNLTDGLWQVNLSVPIRDRAGTLLGVVSAGIDPSLLTASLANAGLSSDFFTLVTRDLLMVARRPWLDDRIGTSMAKAAIFEDLKASPTGFSSGVYLGAIDGRMRIGAAQRIFGDELVFSSSREMVVALRFWSLFENFVALVSAGLLLLVGGLAWLAHRRLVSEIRHSGELAALNNRLEEESAKVAQLARVKSDFMASMSHEIRTPMNAILGLAHLLGTTALSGNQRALVSKIEVAGRSLLGILNDILDLTKVEAGRMELERAPFRLSEVLGSLATIMSVNTAGKDLELVVGAEPDVPDALIGDSLRLQQVLINLAGNAIKFTERGDVVVRVERAGGSEHAPVLRFVVRDTGIGIPANRLGALFDAFSQADSSITRRYGGTGLGLAISKRLVELMGGTIGVDSVAGSGSTFWFTVPFGRVAEGPKPEAAAAPLDVLIADDHPVARDVLEVAARSLGWRPDCVADGVEAVDRVRHRLDAGQPIDVLVLDWRMPGMDGLSAGRAIRAMAGSGVAPIVIMVTAAAQEEILADPGAAVADAILVKPVTPSSLFNAVTEARARRQGGAAALIARGAAVPDGGRLKGLRLLLVEDNEINQEVAGRILEREGARVTVAANGQEAVDRLRTDPGSVDAVLMDVQMPVMDGYEATRRIRGDLGLARMPVIALTAGALPGERAKAAECGMDDFIPKPFDIDRMVAAILQRVPTRPGTAAAGVAPGSRLGVFPAIPGVDPVQAEGRFGGDWPFYQDLLRAFVDQFGTVTEELRRNLTAGDHAAFRMRVHALKGAAANLAVVEIAGLAASLESAMRDGAGTDAVATLDRLESAMADLAAGLTAAAGSGPGNG